MNINEIKEMLTQDVIDIFKRIRNDVGCDYRIDSILTDYDFIRDIMHCEIELILLAISFDTFELARKKIELYGKDAAVIDEFNHKLFDKYRIKYLDILNNVVLDLCGIKFDMKNIIRKGD